MRDAGQPSGWNRDHLNRETPANSDAALGTRLDNLINAHNALCAKLDADTAVTESDYVATLAQPSLDDPAE